MRPGRAVGLHGRGEDQQDRGESVIPGTEDKQSTASATAEIESLCTFEPPAEDAADDVLPRLACKDRNWDTDPEDLGVLPEPEDLFDVHLAD